MSESIRVFKPVVQIDPAKHPELAKELAAIPNERAHAERIRMLATSFLRIQEMGVSLTSIQEDVDAGRDDQVSVDEQLERSSSYGNITI